MIYIHDDDNDYYVDIEKDRHYPSQHESQQSPSLVSSNDSWTSSSSFTDSERSSHEDVLRASNVVTELANLFSIDKTSNTTLPTRQQQSSCCELPETNDFVHLKRRSTSLPLQKLPQKSSMKDLSASSSSSSLSSDNSSNNSAKKSVKRSVSFGSLQAREYNIALSDHPSCSFGPPVQLGWQYTEKPRVSIDTYEKANKQQNKSSPRVLSYNVRKKLLLKHYSKDEVKAAIREVERVKRERMMTDMMLPIDSVVQNITEMFTR